MTHVLLRTNLRDRTIYKCKRTHVSKTAATSVSIDDLYNVCWKYVSSHRNTLSKPQSSITIYHQDTTRKAQLVDCRTTKPKCPAQTVTFFVVKMVTCGTINNSNRPTKKNKNKTREQQLISAETVFNRYTTVISLPEISSSRQKGGHGRKCER